MYLSLLFGVGSGVASCSITFNSINAIPEMISARNLFTVIGQ